MLNSAERNDYQNESIGPKPKKSLKSRRNQKLIKAVGSFAPQEFGEIVKQENMKDYNPIVLDSLSEVNKGVLENPWRFSNHDRDDSDHSSKMNSKSEGKNNSFTAEQTNNFEDVAALPPLLNDPIEALENYSNPDGLNESKVSTVLNIKINDQDEDQKSDSNPIQPLGKPKCKKKHKEWKHKNKDGHKHHKHQSNHKNKSSDKWSTIKKSETSSSHSRTPVLQARKVENKSSPSKSSTPKMNTRRDLMAENLKNKAEELVMKRINKEKRKNTEDVNYF